MVQTFGADKVCLSYLIQSVQSLRFTHIFFGFTVLTLTLPFEILSVSEQSISPVILVPLGKVVVRSEILFYFTFSSSITSIV